MNVDRQTFEKCEITLNNLDDVVTYCKFIGCTINSRVNVMVYSSVIIDSKNQINYIPLSDKEPRAKMAYCVFEDCQMPDGFYQDNHVIHSSVADKETKKAEQ